MAEVCGYPQTSGRLLLWPAVAVPARCPDEKNGRAGHDQHPDALQAWRVIGATEHHDGDA
jgi:hypothetical protein